MSIINVAPGVDALKNAMIAAQAGDTLLLAAGLYTEGIVELKSNVNIIGPNADIVGDSDDRVLEAELKNVTLAVPSSTTISNVRIAGCKFTGNPTHNCWIIYDAEYTNTIFNFEVINNMFVTNDDPLTSGEASIHINGSSGYINTNINISGNLFDSSLFQGNSTVSDINLFIAKDIVISGNTSINCDYAFLQIDSCQNVEISDNIVYHADNKGVQICATRGYPTENVKVHDNEFVDCNVVEDDDHGAIRIYAPGVDGYSDIVIYDNTISDSFNGITFKHGDYGNASNYLQIYNNLFDNNRHADIFNDADSGTFHVTPAYDTSGQCQEINLFTSNSTASEIIVGECLVEAIPYERPVYVWNRANHTNFYAKMYIGQPDTGKYPPIDVLFRSPIDSFDDVHVIVRSIGTIGSNNFIVIDGANINDLPKRGTIRFLSKNENLIWKYDTKALTDGPSGTVMLIGSDSIPETAEGTVEPTADEMSVAVILHEDYNTYCCRLEFNVNNTPGSESVQLQFRIGILDMDEEYEFNEAGESDNLVKGFMPGSFAVSKWFTQNGFWSGPGSTISDPSNFIVYPGGYISGQEVWNKLELMCRDNQLWIWWNGLLITPDLSENMALTPPPIINVSNPYFDIAGSPEAGIPAAPSIGQFGLRLWPGAKLRSIIIRDQAIKFSEMQHNQLQIVT